MLGTLIMLRALLWKDARVNRLPLLMGLVMLMVPYIITSAAIMQMPLWSEATPQSAWAILLATGSYFSLTCSQAGLAMLSGHLIAVERADRSVEFIAYLPPTRGQLLVSKAILLASAVATVWGSNLLIGTLADQLSDSPNGARALTADLASLTTVAAIGTLAIATGWAATCMLEGTGAAVAFAILSPMILVGALQSLGYAAGWPDEFSFDTVYRGACWSIAAAMFAIGTIHFLLRIEP